MPIRRGSSGADAHVVIGRWHDRLARILARGAAALAGPQRVEAVIQGLSELIKEKDIFRAIFDRVPVMMDLLEANGRIVLINREWERTLGWSAEEIERNDVDVFAECYPDPQYRESILRFIADANGEWCDFKTRTRDGRVIDTAWAVVRLADGTRIGIGQDITERRRTQEALQTFSQRLVEVQEAEGRHLARELHDEIGQLLTGLILRLEASTRLPAEEGMNSVREAQKLANELLSRVRGLSLDLRPAALDDLGLLPALLWQFERYTLATGVRVVFAHAAVEGRRFAPEIETAAYRIIQEALTNVARHAETAEAFVSISRVEDRLRVKIEDHGVGFDREAAGRTVPASGLTGMHERARLVHGRVRVESAPGAGTRVTAELSLDSRS
jgi:PAS domain S-box-containing protein